jgi:hypothetical protein
MKSYLNLLISLLIVLAALSSVATKRFITLKDPSKPQHKKAALPDRWETLGYQQIPQHDGKSSFREYMSQLHNIHTYHDKTHELEQSTRARLILQ